MPQHHHGFPTKPHVTEALGDGRYLLDGVKFSMTGWWQFKLKVESGSGSDLVVFNTVVNDPGAPAAVASSK
ncbi:FixH family protein [Massilia sp. H-1]|nr:FixH family protein [Massilia sp. H-1]